MKMIELLDAQAKQYLAGINLRNIQVEALNKLLSTNYNSDAKDALTQSGFTDGMLSARQLHSLIVNQAASWVVGILQGNWVACPIPKAAGLNQSLVIQWFKDHGEGVAQRIATKKALRAKQKADAKAQAEKLEPEETFTQGDIEQAFKDGQHDVLNMVYAVSAADIGRSMILDLIETLDCTDRQWLLAALAAKYPATTSGKRGKGTADQPSLIS